MQLDSLIQLEAHTTQPYKFGQDWRLAFAVPVASMNGMIVSVIDTIDTWDRVTLGTNFNKGNDIDHLEDDETHISTDYDYISDLIQAVTWVVPK